MNEELTEVIETEEEQIVTENEDAVSQRHMVNHDLTTLFLIARTIAPHDFLNALLYGDFTDPTPEDIENAKAILASNGQSNEGGGNSLEEAPLLEQLDETIPIGDSKEQEFLNTGGDETEPEYDGNTYSDPEPETRLQ